MKDDPLRGKWRFPRLPRWSRVRPLLGRSPPTRMWLGHFEILCHCQTRETAEGKCPVVCVTAAVPRYCPWRPLGYLRMDAAQYAVRAIEVDASVEMADLLERRCQPKPLPGSGKWRDGGLKGEDEQVGGTSTATASPLCNLANPAGRENRVSRKARSSRSALSARHWTPSPQP